jgi:non-ribosomal peptide synthetase component F
MRSLLGEIQALLAASRAVACADELDAAGLQQWSSEREAVFIRLQSHDLAGAAADSPELAALIRELVRLDDEIRARVIEYQARIGEQIAASQRVRRVLLPDGKDSASLLRVSA